MALPAAVYSYTKSLVPIAVSPTSHMLDIPIIGQYIYGFTLLMQPYFAIAPQAKITLVIGGTDIATLYATGSSLFTLNFFHNPYNAIITEALFKTKSAYLRVDFADTIQSSVNYVIQYTVGFLYDENIKQFIKKYPIHSVSADNRLVVYYDGITWVS